MESTSSFLWQCLIIFLSFQSSIQFQQSSQIRLIDEDSNLAPDDGTELYPGSSYYRQPRSNKDGRSGSFLSKFLDALDYSGIVKPSDVNYVPKRRSYDPKNSRSEESSGFVPPRGFGVPKGLRGSFGSAPAFQGPFGGESSSFGGFLGRVNEGAFPGGDIERRVDEKTRNVAGYVKKRQANSRNSEDEWNNARTTEPHVRYAAAQRRSSNSFQRPEPVYVPPVPFTPSQDSLVQQVDDYQRHEPFSGIEEDRIRETHDVSQDPYVHPKAEFNFDVAKVHTTVPHSIETTPPSTTPHRTTHERMYSASPAPPTIESFRDPIASPQRSRPAGGPHKLPRIGQDDRFRPLEATEFRPHDGLRQQQFDNSQRIITAPPNFSRRHRQKQVFDINVGASFGTNRRNAGIPGRRINQDDQVLHPLKQQAFSLSRFQ